MLTIKNDNVKEEITIEGAVYSHALFKSLVRVGDILKIVKMEDGVTTVFNMKACPNGTKLEKELYDLVSRIEKEANV